MSNFKKVEILLSYFLILLFLILILPNIKGQLGYEIYEIYNDTGVKYQPRIFYEFNRSQIVPLIIYVKDISGIVINVSDTPENRTKLLYERKEILDKKIDLILSDLSGDFKLKDRFITGDGFYGNATEHGFKKLLNNSNVSTIYIDRSFTIGEIRVSNISLDFIYSDLNNSIVKEIDGDILVEFNKSYWVPIIVQTYERNLSKIEDIISNLSDYELRDVRVLQSLNGFSGEMTLEGFNKLRFNSNIKFIWRNIPISVAKDIETQVSEPYSEVLEINNYSDVRYQQKIIEEFATNSAVGVIVKTKESNDTSLSEIESRDFLENKTRLVLSSLPPSEFKLKRQYTWGFSGNITRAGFERLLNNSNVKEIFLLEKLYSGVVTVNKKGDIKLQITESYYEVLEVNNISGVKYHLEILEKLVSQVEVSVIINIKDTSGITVSLKNTIEEQENLDALKKEILDSKIDSILSNLTLAEFKLKGRFITGHGFYGNITRDGFNKLINNSDIAEIRYDRVARVHVAKSNFSSFLNQSKETFPTITDKENKSNNISLNSIKNITMNEYQIKEPKTKFTLSLSNFLRFIKTLFGFS